MIALLQRFAIGVAFSSMLSFGALTAQNYNTIPLAVIVGTPETVDFTAYYAAVTNITPQHGTISFSQIGTNFTMTYTPHSGYLGLDTFGISKVVPGNPLPVFKYERYVVSVAEAHTNANDDYATTTAGSSVLVDVLTNDETTYGTLSVSDVVVTNGGVATISGDHILFTPANGFTGAAYLRYTTCNELQACDAASVGIYVSPLTLPAYDTISVFTQKGETTFFMLPEGFSLTATPTQSVVSALPQASNVYRYAPKNGFVGLETLDFTTSGGAKHMIVKVLVMGTSSNNKHAIPDFAYTALGEPITLNLLKNDIGRLDIDYLTSCNGGTLVNTHDTAIVFTPYAGFSGVATFSYHVRPKPGTLIIGTPLSEWATVKIMVSNQEPAQNNYSFYTYEGTPMVLSYNTTLTNFSFEVFQEPAQGILSYYPGAQTINLMGQTCSGNNMLVYIPNGTAINDNFTVMHCVGGDCTPVSVTVNTVAANDPSICLDNCVWPGDANSDGEVDIKDLLPIGLNMGFTGTPRPNADLGWVGQYGDDWYNYATVFANGKHADTDGNGIASSVDTVAIIQNYGLTHELQNPALYFPYETQVDFNILNTDIQPGDLVIAEILLGTDDAPVLNSYGLTFKVDYNASLIVDSTVHASFEIPSWLNANTAMLEMEYKPGIGLLDAGGVRTDMIAADGYGPVGTLSFIVIDNIDGIQSNGNIELALNFRDITTADGEGRNFKLPNATMRVPVRIPAKEEVIRADLVVYPNPARDVANLYLNGGTLLQEVTLLSVDGSQLWKATNINSKQLQIPVSDLPNGVYLVRADNGNEQIVEKIIVQR